MPEAAVIETVSAAATHDLRRWVLRGGAADAVVEFPEDAWPGAFHLALRPSPDQEPLAVATFFPEPTPLRPGLVAWRLRGMAVEQAQQGSGLGRALLTKAVAVLAAKGADVCWANARDSALGFYRRLGFCVEGNGFDLNGHPHHRVVLDL